MTQEDVARDFLRLLEKLDIPYLIVGSYSSNAWGHPRATHDLDLVIECDEDLATRLVGELDEGYYADGDAAREAVRRKHMFNAIHVSSGTKVDLWIRPDTEYERTRFARRKRVDLWGMPVSVATAEDVILAKLMWYRDGGQVSNNQWNDCRGVWEVQANELDHGYLDSWAGKLEIVDLLARLKKMPLPGEKG